MGMVIKNNSAAKSTLNTLNKNSKAMSKSMAKVSSGMKINGAADDAAGYAISERMRVQIRGLDQDIQNTENASSLLHVGEGAVSSTVDIMRTMKAKAIQAANDTNTDTDRAIIQKEFDEYIDQIDDNANITFNGKYLFAGGQTTDDSTTSAAQQQIVNALYSEWLENSLQLIEDTYGLSFTEDGTSVKEMAVQFKNEGSGTLAYVTSSYVDGIANKLTMTVNMDYYSALIMDDVNGDTTTAGAGYLDRTIAHEMVHAVMAANIKDFGTMPAYLKEGLAEAVHGIDDYRQSTIKTMLSNADTLKTAYSNTSNKAADFTAFGSDSAYAMGYVLSRYLAKQAGGSATAVMKSFMQELDENGGSITAINNAISKVTGGTIISLSSLTEKLCNDLSACSGDTDKFLKDYCNIILPNDDTGALSGQDAGVSTVAKTAESIVPEAGSTSFWTAPTTSTTTIRGLTVTWPEENVGAGTGGNKFVFQVGTKANQAINFSFADIHAEALGMKAKDGTTISVATREKAVSTMEFMDKAIQVALDEQTSIGAMISRLSYTADNLTIASENVTSSESVIRDADMAKEMADYTKNNVLMQAAQSMLAQANQNSSEVLSLLQ